MEEAIKKAIEGGWKGLEFNDSIRIDNFRPADVHSRVWGESILGEQHITTIAQIVCDPQFWIALGKSMKWKEDKPKVSITTDLGVMSSRVLYEGHLAEWHRFIDHLVVGKDIDSFFRDLIK